MKRASVTVFPEGDGQFQETTVEKVETEKGGWSIRREDGWSFYIKEPSPVTPRAGMRARFYGSGIGSVVRGLFLDGVKVFYRTAAENAQHQNELLYGKDIKDWLARWDAGQSVWSITMGGFGPTYEQCLQVAAVEIVRHLVGEARDPILLSDPRVWAALREELERTVLRSPAVEELQLSGMQWSAAMNLAGHLYRSGPIKFFNEPAMKDRHIQVMRWFPGAARK